MASKDRGSYINGIEESNRRFFAALATEDDLGAIIRMHSFIEHELKEYILTASPRPEHIKFSSYDYTATLQLAFILGLNAELKAALSAIGGLRNRFAHQHDAELTIQDATNLYNALNASCKSDLQQGYAATLKTSKHRHLPKSTKDLPPRIFVGLCAMTLRSAVMAEHLQIHTGRVRRNHPIREYDKELSDEELEMRLTYASVGHAVQASTNLESQLHLALLVAEFLPKIRKKADQTGISKQLYQRELNAYKKAQDGRKMEHVIYRLYAMSVFDGGLKTRLMEAAKSQHFLLHRLLRERIMSMATPQGMRELQEELDGYFDIFGQLSEEIARIIKPMQVSFGMNPEESEAFADQMADKLSLPEFLKNTRTTGNNSDP